ncbi:MAG: ferritin family protein [Acidobacteriota bacterium]
MDIQLVFTPLARFEEELSCLYEGLAEQFADDPGARFLFYRLATEEKAHAALIEYQRRVVSQDPGLFGEVSVDLEVIRRAAEKVEEARSCSSRPSLQEAVAMAFDFEHSAAEFHYRTAMKEANEEFARLLDSLGVSDRQHYTALSEFAEKRGIQHLRT